jgi:hypothetical protein
MLSPTPPKYRKHHVLPKRTPPTPTPAALTLLEAVYLNDDGPYVRLKFDRAIDLSGLDGAQIDVKDGIDLGVEFLATGTATLLDPQTVRIDLVTVGDYSGDDLLTASASNGIVAVDDGGTWAGVTNLGLPWP